MDSLHYALLAVLALLLVYCGTRFFREGNNYNRQEQAPTKPKINVNSNPIFYRLPGAAVNQQQKPNESPTTIAKWRELYNN